MAFITSDKSPTTPEQMLSNDFSKYRILVVDDNEVQREVLYELVKSLGAECDMASGATEAMQIIRKTTEMQYSMIISDIFMPDENGFILAQRVRAMTIPGANTIPILGISADTDPELYDHAISVGMNGMMLKPVSIQILAAYFTLMLKASCVSSVFTSRLASRIDSERKIRQFVRDSSHALRTPLHAIMGFAQLLAQDGISDEDRKAFAESICTACESANKVLNNSQISFEG